MKEYKEQYHCKDCDHYFAITFIALATPFCPCCGSDNEDFIEEVGVDKS